jgi:ribosomal protein S18 acetylase RimI-like enzyme
VDDALDRILHAWREGQSHRASLLGGRQVEHDGLVTTLTGIPASWLNPTSVVREPADPPAAIAAAEAAYPPGLGFGVDVVVDRFPGVRAALARSGLRCHSTEWLMTLDVYAVADVAAPDGVVIGRAEDRLAEVAEVDAAAFGDPLEISRSYLAPAVFADPSFRAYAAVFEGRLVAAAETTLVAGILRVTGVAVIESVRRRGIASALTSFAVRDHGSGADVAFLEAGGEAARLYERLGFRPVTTWEIWVRETS